MNALKHVIGEDKALLVDAVEQAQTWISLSITITTTLFENVCKK